MHGFQQELTLRKSTCLQKLFSTRCATFIGKSFDFFTETVHVVYRFIMINQYQLMSHMTVHQPKFDRFVLGTTSKYITNYIEQRKVLILAKLARNNHQSDKISDESIEFPKNTHIERHQKGDFKQEGKRERPRSTSQVLEFQRPNKINKNVHFHRNNDTDKFLSRSSMYQKQKHLNFQLQKRKSLYTQASGHRFQPELPKKDESSQSKQTERKKQKLQESYQLKHDKKYSKRQENQRIRYKDLMRQSMTKFNETKQNSTTINDQKERWKKIQQIFDKIKPNTLQIDHHPKVEEQHTIKNFEEKDIKQDYLHDLQVNQLKLTLKKVESEQENVKDFIQNLQMEQHFEQDLSGILMDDDQKEEVDSSHVFQNVVKEMMLESEIIVPETVEQKCCKEIEIVQCTSILGLNEAEQQEDVAVATNHNHKLIQVREDEWIKKQSDEQSNNEHIEIKKVESQIIEDSQVQPLDKSQELVESKVYQIIEHHNDVLEEHQSVNESLIDKLSDQMLAEEVQKEQVVREDSRQNNEIQKQSLQTLANQFLLLAPNTKNNEQDDDLSIPDQESLSINLQFFNFNTVNHEITASFINIIAPLQKTVIKDEPSQPAENQYQQQNEQTIEQIQEQQEVYHEEPRITSVIRTLLGLGEFLMIPEQSEQQSHQSIG